MSQYVTSYSLGSSLIYTKILLFVDWIIDTHVALTTNGFLSAVCPEQKYLGLSWKPIPLGSSTWQSCSAINGTFTGTLLAHVTWLERNR